MNYHVMHVKSVKVIDYCLFLELLIIQLLYILFILMFGLLLCNPSMGMLTVETSLINIIGTFGYIFIKSKLAAF